MVAPWKGVGMVAAQHKRIDLSGQEFSCVFALYDVTVVWRGREGSVFKIRYFLLSVKMGYSYRSVIFHEKLKLT